MPSIKYSSQNKEKISFSYYMTKNDPLLVIHQENNKNEKER